VENGNKVVTKYTTTLVFSFFGPPCKYSPTVLSVWI